MLNEGTIQKIVGKHKWTIVAVASRGRGDGDTSFTLGEIQFLYHSLSPARTGDEEERESSCLGRGQAALLNVRGEACC